MYNRLLLYLLSIFYLNIESVKKYVPLPRKIPEHASKHASVNICGKLADHKILFYSYF